MLSSNSYEKVNAAKKLLEKDITILVDINGRLANACGVYSTPQAVLFRSMTNYTSEEIIQSKILHRCE